MSSAQDDAKRNPRPEFKDVEAARPDWDEKTESWRFTKTVKPDWPWGHGANDGGASLATPHVEIDPYAPGRPAMANYKLLISAIIPRPIGFLSTMAADGSSSNLAPFSFTNMVCFDPPVFTVGFTTGIADAKDTLANLAASKECVLSIISEHFVEAANSTSVDAPYGVSEWALSGLHPAPSSMVRPPRVLEAVFAAECKLLELKEFDSKANPGKKSGTLALLEGVNFWVREDAINEEQSIVDPGVLRPISRLGGITYGRLTEGFEIPRPDFKSVSQTEHVQELLKNAPKP